MASRKRAKRASGSCKGNAPSVTTIAVYAGLTQAEILLQRSSSKPSCRGESMKIGGAQQSYAALVAAGLYLPGQPPPPGGPTVPGAPPPGPSTAPVVPLGPAGVPYGPVVPVPGTPGGKEGPYGPYRETPMP